MAKPVLTYLTREELESMHLASTKILEKTGVRFPYKPALDLFRDGGASVDYETSIVKITPKMIEDALAKVPKELHLFARDPKHDIHITDISQRWPIWGSMSGTVAVLDRKTKKRRPLHVKDIIEYFTIADFCTNIDIAEAVGTPMDVPLEVSNQHAYSTVFKNFTKPVVLTPETLEATKDIIQMGIAVAGGEKSFRKRPLINMMVLTVPPLNNDGGAVAGVLEGLKYGIQLRVSAGTMAGASSPVTLPGCLAQANAEALSWMVLVQLANPGNEFALGMNPRIMDMRYGTVSLSSPEWAIMRACIGDIGRYYDLQTQAFMMVSASKLIDAQAGYEKALTGLMTGLGGVTVAMGCIMDSQNMCCTADLPFTDEIIAAIKRILGGFEVNEETLAVDLIDEVAHQGNFLDTEHTLNHYKEHWQPALLERRSYAEWKDSGAKDQWERLVERAEQILSSHKVEPLPAAVDRELDEIVNAAEKRMGLS